MKPRNSSAALLSHDSPKVFHALGRFLNADELACLTLDYGTASALGGNTEPFAQRQEGVSYNPRLARVISILTHDLGIRDLLTIRAALYGAVVIAGCALQQPECLHKVVSSSSPEVSLLLDDLCKGSHRNPISALILGVVVLDDIRHLHQSALSVTVRESVLIRAEQHTDLLVSRNGPSELITRLRHAVALQQRRLDDDPEREI